MRGVFAFLALFFGPLCTAPYPNTALGRTGVVVLIVIVSAAAAWLSVTRIEMDADGIRVRPHGWLGPRQFVRYRDIARTTWNSVARLKTEVCIHLRDGSHVRLGPWPMNTPRFAEVRKRAIEACEAIERARAARPGA